MAFPTPQNANERDVQGGITVHATIPVNEIYSTVSSSSTLSGLVQTDFRIYPGGTNIQNFYLQRGDIIFAPNNGAGVDLPRTGPSKIHGITAHYSVNGIIPRSADASLTGEELNSKYEPMGPSKSDIDVSNSTSTSSGVALYTSVAATVNAPGIENAHFGNKMAPVFPNVNEQVALSAASKLAQGNVASSSRIMPLLHPCEGPEAAIQKLINLVLNDGHEAFSTDALARIATAKTNCHKAIASIAMGGLLSLYKNGMVQLFDGVATDHLFFEMQMAKILGLTDDAFVDSSNLESNEVLNDIMKTVFDDHPKREDVHESFIALRNLNDVETEIENRSTGNLYTYGIEDFLSEQTRKVTTINTTGQASLSLVEACSLNPYAEADTIIGSILGNSNANALNQRVIPMFLHSTTIIN